MRVQAEYGWCNGGGGRRVGSVKRQVEQGTHGANSSEPNRSLARLPSQSGDTPTQRPVRWVANQPWVSGTTWHMCRPPNHALAFHHRPAQKITPAQGGGRSLHSKGFRHPSFPANNQHPPPLDQSFSTQCSRHHFSRCLRPLHACSHFLPQACRLSQALTLSSERCFHVRKRCPLGSNPLGFAKA